MATGYQLHKVYIGQARTPQGRVFGSNEHSFASS